MTKKILLAGESWTSYTTHVKGFDSFYTSTYETGEKWLKKALEAGGYEVTFMPNHIAAESFPYEMDELKNFDSVILSDIGSDSLLIPNITFTQSERRPNRCDLIRDYVLQGGGLLMVGGYMTFTGVDAKGRWGMTSVQEVLPVTLMQVDDRQEHPEGIFPKLIKDHPALKKISGAWPYFMGYNKSKAMPDAEVLVTIGGDPLVALAERGKGRCAVFASDCAPHWGPPPFVNWEHYDDLWQGLMDWLTKQI